MFTYTLETINKSIRAEKVTVIEDYGHQKRVVTKWQCPNCRYLFKMAPRCPECGQLIENWKFRKVVRRTAEPA